MNLPVNRQDGTNDGMHPGREHSKEECACKECDAKIDREVEPFKIAAGKVAQKDLCGHAGNEHSHHLLYVDFKPV